MVTHRLTCLPMASVLVVEDDPVIRAALIEVLTGHGYAVKTTHQGFEALREITQSPPDIVVLDLGLPDLDGLDVLRMIRGISRVPVLVATARDDDTEVIRLLNAGADDYMVKPFSGGQLAARLGAVLRRSAPADVRAARQPAVRVAGLRVDPTARTAHLDGRELALTRREFDLLAYLAAHADQVVSRQRILAEVWQQPYLEDQTVDVHLSALRRKLGEKARQPRLLHTVRGIGIKLVSSP
ncbi:response regulator transcription factor [Streptomyces ziwulingensis]|uniref:Response regulator transcription factor n=2 Tax=Streptomyces ziwulingensis TaxID=1045501 RepID=A0ABP9BS41_9ACTN